MLLKKSESEIRSTLDDKFNRSIIMEYRKHEFKATDEAVLSLIEPTYPSLQSLFEITRRTTDPIETYNELKESLGHMDQLDAVIAMFNEDENPSEDLIGIKNAAIQMKDFKVVFDECLSLMECFYSNLVDYVKKNSNGQDPIDYVKDSKNRDDVFKEIFNDRKSAEDYFENVMLMDKIGVDIAFTMVKIFPAAFITPELIKKKSEIPDKESLKAYRKAHEIYSVKKMDEIYGLKTA